MPDITLYFSPARDMTSTGGMNTADIFHCGPAALISALFDELKIGQTIDEMINWDRAQQHMSPGTPIKALIINVFSRKGAA